MANFANILRFAAVNLDRKSGGPTYPKIIDDLAMDNESRTNFLKACLVKLGLIVTQETASVPSLSRIHLSSLNHTEVPELLEDLKDIITIEDGEEYIKGENDTFHIENQSSRWSFNNLKTSLSLLSSREMEGQVNSGPTVDTSGDRILDYNAVTKRLIPHETTWPGSKETPYFNHHAFFANLKIYQEEQSSEAEEFGTILMYGEVVTSTNTLLEKLVTSLHSQNKS